MKNVLWGYDHDDTQMIDNQNGTYGQTLYTAKEIGTGGSYKIHLTTDVENESWFQNDDPSVIKSYAVVPSDTMKTSLNSLIKSSASRVRVVFTNKPATYKEGITSSYLKRPVFHLSSRSEAVSRMPHIHISYIVIKIVT